MPISDEERQSIINEAIEKAVLRLPAVVTKLMEEKAALKKLADAFFLKNKEFNSHKKIVASTIEEIETANPGMQYAEMLTKAEPKIKQRIATIGKLDKVNISKPVRLDFIDNGEI